MIMTSLCFSPFMILYNILEPPTSRFTMNKLIISLIFIFVYSSFKKGVRPPQTREDQFNDQRG